MLTPVGEDLHEIRPGLWLGSVHAARDRSVAERRGITHIVSIILDPWAELKLPARTSDPVDAKMARELAPTSEDPVHCLLIDGIDDVPTAPLSHYFAAAHKFCARARSSGGRVLVHCMAGRSRSASIVAAHLIMAERISTSEALASIAAKRPGIDPNAGFVEQLRALAVDEGLETREATPTGASRAAATRLEVLDMLERRLDTLESSSLPGVAAKAMQLEVEIDAVHVSPAEVELRQQRRELGDRCRRLMS